MAPFALRGVGAFIALLLTALTPADVDAQLPTLQPGLRVRVDARPVVARRVVGTLMLQTQDTLVVASSASEWHRVPIAVVASLDVHMGRSRRSGLRRGLLLGAGIIGGGVLIGGGLATDDDFVFPVALTGTSIGALAGFFIGSDRWLRVFLRQ
jgi:hypothetical protein